jgi:hypothetical protein
MMNIEKYHITEDSFGSELPTNWQEIASYLNEKIDAALGNMDDEIEAHEEANLIWENYCNGVYADAPEAC